MDSHATMQNFALGNNGNTFQKRQRIWAAMRLNDADDDVNAFLDALMPGETMRFCNDHDPLPLLAQAQNRYGDALRIEYMQREPGAIVIDFTRQ